MRVGGPVANLINLLPPPDCLPLSAPGSPLSPRKLWPALINVPLLLHQSGLGWDQVQSWQAASWIWILIPPTLSTLLPGLVITVLQTLGAGSEARIGMMGWVIIFFYRLFIISISSFEHSSFRFLTIKIQSNFTMDHVGMRVWWKCRERGGSLDTTIGIEFEYPEPERANGWRTDADCVCGRPAASCSARWVTGLIVGFGNRRPDVLIQRKFTMWHNSWWWGKCWVNLWNWTFMDGIQ